jgi:hypothetical protein
MTCGTNSFHESVHIPGRTRMQRAVDDHGQSESAGQKAIARWLQATGRNYSRPGRPLIGGGAPRELGGAAVERTLEDGHYVYGKTSRIMPADTSI